MPKGDRTGPRAGGPRSGRAAGFCSGSDVPGYANQASGRGCGFGGGRGWRNRFYATGIPGRMRGTEPMPVKEKTSPQQEKHSLEIRARSLRAELDQIKEKLSNFKDHTDPQ
jgi:hypothetical protein